MGLCVMTPTSGTQPACVFLSNHVARRAAFPPATVQITQIVTRDSAPETQKVYINHEQIQKSRSGAAQSIQTTL